MLICPTCGAYYAAGTSTFCPLDGQPLVSIDPGSDKWDEASRVLDEKDKTLQRRKRSLKWRRVLLTTATVLVATLFLYGAFDLETTPVDNTNRTANSNGNADAGCSDADKSFVIKAIKDKFVGFTLVSSEFPTCAQTSIVVACKWRENNPDLPDKVKCEKTAGDWRC
jgi:hypothetical protein